MNSCGGFPSHPAHWTDELFETIAECPKLARYVDMPLQHIHPTCWSGCDVELAGVTSSSSIKPVARWHSGHRFADDIHWVSRRNRSCFERLLEFIRRLIRAPRASFTYSHEDGTRAANMSPPDSEQVKKERRDRAMAEQLIVARGVARSFVGRTIAVLVEKPAWCRDLARAGVKSWEHGLVRSEVSVDGAPDGPYLAARGEADAPDIDGRVYLRGRLPAGAFARVKIIGHTDYDLIAERA